MLSGGSDGAVNGSGWLLMVIVVCATGCMQYTAYVPRAVYWVREKVVVVVLCVIIYVPTVVTHMQ